ncbi:hypothetical protein B739_0836 [Riemerella anatipestifer RA-CH-1]|uniref:Uncharacterized protein n=1 Tax=Riemerella anatipestifer RA-CH-1 TaxID=1228997 RepID=J9R6P8_RIEAN|nr:hypothetical protein B739_0836 [Riemerella anatipestifer RA-CH-1]
MVDLARRIENIERYYNNQVRKKLKRNKTLSETGKTYNGEFDPGSG